MAYVRTNEPSSERYTPKTYVDAARELMGGVIELDPTSCESANETVRAVTYYGSGHDAFNVPWVAGTVWFNPPYGRHEAIKLGTKRDGSPGWMDKLASEYDAGRVGQAVTIVPMFPAQKWFHKLWRFPMCILYDRVRFIDGATMLPMLQPMYGHCMIWLPPQRDWDATEIKHMHKHMGHLGKIIAGVRD